MPSAIKKLSETKTGDSLEDHKAGKKSSKLDFRISSKHKNMIIRAAGHLKMDVSGFILDAVIPKAEEVIEHHERLHLEKEEWGSFLHLIENPPEPAEHLRQAMAKHLARSK